MASNVQYTHGGKYFNIMAGRMTEIDKLCLAVNGVDISSPVSTTDSESDRPFSSLAPTLMGDFKRTKEVDAERFSKQPWICKIDSVRHRLRGILITQDTYNLFRRSFGDDWSSREFLGRLLEAMSATGRIMRMSELQLEQINSRWDEALERYMYPQFKPVDLPVLVAFKVAYAVSTKWEIVKTLYYAAFSEDIFEKLCEDAITKSSLNSLMHAKTVSMQDEVRPLRHFGEDLSVEQELSRAIESSSSTEPRNSYRKLLQFITQPDMLRLYYSCHDC